MNETPEPKTDLAHYIVRFLRRRNRNELRSCLDAMTEESRSLMVEELAWILAHDGHPPNWVPEPSVCPIWPTAHGRDCSCPRPAPNEGEDL